MKKNLILVAAAAMMMASCGSTLGTIGTSVLTNVLTGGQGTATTQTTTQENSTQSSTGDLLGGVLNSVLGISGANALTAKTLVGSWTYSKPGCAFTSDKLLAQAGGEVIAAEIKSKLEPTFNKVGIKSSNTTIAFKEDGTFSAKIAGKGWSGNYTFDESTGQIALQGLLINLTCYAKKTANGIGLLFESNKLLTLLQTMTALSGNSSLSAIGDLMKSYNGLRLGFEFK